MAEDYVRLIGFRLILIGSLLWAWVGPWVFGYLVQRLGWDKIGIELRWTLFVAFTLVCMGAAASAVLGVASFIRRRQ